MTGPLVQLYCKKLTVENVGAFIAARPDHIGWQINLEKVSGSALDAALREAAALAGHIERAGIRTVFLLHPSTDARQLIEAIKIVRPNIFLASAARNEAALRALAAEKICEIMIPIGIPTSAKRLATYDAVSEAEAVSSFADWLTTDTITDADSVDRFGCSGQTSEWGTLARIVNAGTTPVVAAGGLTPENVAALWQLCQPAGFDAHTAVCTNGLPDEAKARAFVDAVKRLPPRPKSIGA